jgi:hypothetical protein
MKPTVHEMMDHFRFTNSGTVSSIKVTSKNYPSESSLLIPVFQDVSVIKKRSYLEGSGQSYYNSHDFYRLNYYRYSMDMEQAYNVAQTEHSKMLIAFRPYLLILISIVDQR